VYIKKKKKGKQVHSKDFTVANLLVTLLELSASPAPHSEGFYTVWLAPDSLNFTHSQHRKKFWAQKKTTNQNNN